MIRELHGNLLADDADALVNTVNTVGVMGKGIALQFKRAFPEMFRDYERAAKSGAIEVGRMHVWATGAMTGPRYIINFPTKRHWRAPSRMPDIEEGLADLARVIRELDIASVAVPPLGCGNGGLAWGDVAPRIHAALGGLESVDVRLYAPAGAPAAREMIDRTAAPPITPTRAALLGLMSAYQRLSWEWPSQLETQKLAYFLQTAGQPMKLKFEKGHYGPYADNLRQALRDMEGHYILGFGDGTDPALSGPPLEVLPGTREALEPVLAEDGETEARFHRVLDLVGGFETPYGLELLSTVHWAATHEGSDSAEAAREVARRWTRRKAGMFTQEHIDAAWDALDRGGWLARRPAVAL